MGHFVNLAPGDNSTAFFASDLTREYLREVVRLFIAAQPGQHLVPFGRLGTGSINLLVFALLTFIAELKDKQSVIFAMEEPEIALPPHTQRRVTRFVLAAMGQSIVTSHSPYVIEQFDPAQIVILNRDEGGTLTGQPIDAQAVKPKTYRTERRQFAEAILSRAVLVVEGSTEASLFPVASSIMEDSLPTDSYMHFDLAGVSVFDAGADNAVPRQGPIFSALGKLAFGFYDPNAALDQDSLDKLKSYTQAWESPEKGIENVLIKQIPIAVVRRFLSEVKNRFDYPPVGDYDPAAVDADVAALATKVLKARKGEAYGYAAMLIAQCQTASELPATIREILEAIHKTLSAVPEDIGAPVPSDFKDPLG
jgi:putative ATP-dependent endonuclease of the OLD family